ncbi:MAG: hypothetical protein K2M03_02270 [Muribaculaceae bacterium]|nr:hypothetical protein [Muribaculaceae bacterium]
MARGLDRINRWRHRHGFGVHSPLAFIIATEAVSRPSRYMYYEEEKIENETADPRLRKHFTRQCRLRNLIERLNNYGGNCIIRAEYIVNPNPDKLNDACHRLSQTGGILFEGRDYIIIIEREGLTFYRYTV